MSQADAWMLGGFAVAALLYWWGGVGYVAKSPRERESIPAGRASALALAIGLSRVVLTLIAFAGPSMGGWRWLYLLLVVGFILLMATGPHPLDPIERPRSRRDREAETTFRYGDEPDGRGGARRFYEVESAGHPGVLGCLAAMGCLLGAGAIVVLGVALALDTHRIPEHERWQFGGGGALAVLVALLVFGWKGRTVRFEVEPEGFRITRIVLRWLRFRTFRRFDEIEGIERERHVAVVDPSGDGPGATFQRCRMKVPGFLRSVTFGHGEPAESQAELVRLLMQHVEEGRRQG